VYRYRVTIVKVIDGDTVDVDIDLGFSVVLKKQRVRLYEIDTPESRTRDLVEKKFGLLSKSYLLNKLDNADTITLVSHDKGKFGRILGELFIDDDSKSVNMQMVDDHHAVYYYGQNKDDVEQEHLINREWLIKNSKVEMT
jgi:micrococcal nuclease|tara:strand:- start:337 stop:756 length:420 start_codon:yes stop_codon:yes gene_type:complete